eukprot:Blabericola_migrator_1__13583@NODE_99_length_14373_cov_95_300643_g89_i0_p4_GENE_NODE_99_length_14373_cov_95_300643_g89_i0NODE_99_length_14373_cov_95_300643_g89_i0_p4_ORF_typecomplete_len380_score85_92Pkinase/PF00069_25/2_4e30Pkinase_Tyr/PF07714_17/3e11Kinaselike/PF14531_6/0_34Kinaselike/PF14531_6/0_00018WaaY/PF06176_11/0_0087WaaY/PF06176_11/7_5e03Kdo/PF06293_14/0_012Pkinase_fungal/PF17667_1/5_7e03Pkinase_fungal/PF17667_1/0_026_NODE_99_length_14373_cov_95_300643_g89_i02181357
MPTGWRTDDLCFNGVEDIVVLRPLETGTYSHVWLGLDRSTLKFLAIKVQEKDVLENRQTARFQPDGDVLLVSCWETANDELDILRHLNPLCPRVVKLVQVFNLEELNLRLVALEFIPFELLVYNEEFGFYEIPIGCVEDEELEKRQDGICLLNETGFGILLEELMKTLNEFHAGGVVHKDIKPENLRLTKRWHTDHIKYLPWTEIAPRRPTPSHSMYECPLMTDKAGHFWGTYQRLRSRESLNLDLLECDIKSAMAKLSRESTSDTRLKVLDFNVARKTTELKIWDADGSQAYTPPEVLRPGQPKECSGVKRDVWSAGVTLYAAYFGKLPYWDSIPIRLQMAIIMSPLTFPFEAPVNDTLSRLLNKEADLRPEPKDFIR